MAADDTQPVEPVEVEGVLVTDEPLAGTGEAVNAETGEVTQPGDPLPVVVFEEHAEGVRFGVAPITRLTAIQNAEAVASNSAMRGIVTTEQLQRTRIEFADRYDSYWSRDPGRSHGPFS